MKTDIDRVFEYNTSIRRMEGGSLVVVTVLIAAFLVLLAVHELGKDPNQFESYCRHDGVVQEACIAKELASVRAVGFQELLGALVPLAVAGIGVWRFRSGKRLPARRWLENEPGEVVSITSRHTVIRASGSAIGGYDVLTVTHRSGKKSSFKVANSDWALETLAKIAPQAFPGAHKAA
jgi:hypothetical protein